MPTDRNRIPSVPQCLTALTDFYREEFIKHHQCLQAHREYYSAQAVDRVEAVLLRVIREVEQLSTGANANAVVAQLLREFDVVTGLSNWSDPNQVH